MSWCELYWDIFNILKKKTRKKDKYQMLNYFHIKINVIKHLTVEEFVFFSVSVSFGFLSLSGDKISASAVAGHDQHHL